MWNADGRGRIVELALEFARMAVGFGWVVGREVVVGLEEGEKVVGKAEVVEVRGRRAVDRGLTVGDMNMKVCGVVERGRTEGGSLGFVGVIRAVGMV